MNSGVSIYEIAQVVILSLTLYVLWRTLKILDLTRELTADARDGARSDKIIDVMMECDRRFEQLQKDTAIPPDAYWERFWHLQLDQYVYFQHGVLEQHDYEYWMLSRHVEFIKDRQFVSTDSGISEPECRLGIREAWSGIKERWPKHKFMDFVDGYIFTPKDYHRKPYVSRAQIADDVRTRIQDGIAKIKVGR